jgi:hypothetical protein
LKPSTSFGTSHDKRLPLAAPSQSSLGKFIAAKELELEL